MRPAGYELIQIYGNNHNVKHLGRTCVYFCHINLTTSDTANVSVLSLVGKHTAVISPMQHLVNKLIALY